MKTIKDKILNKVSCVAEFITIELCKVIWKINWPKMSKDRHWTTIMLSSRVRGSKFSWHVEITKQDVGEIVVGVAPKDK